MLQAKSITLIYFVINGFIASHKFWKMVKRETKSVEKNQIPIVNGCIKSG
jgi:hypothetical protein